MLFDPFGDVANGGRFSFLSRHEERLKKGDWDLSAEIQVREAIVDNPRVRVGHPEHSRPVKRADGLAVRILEVRHPRQDRERLGDLRRMRGQVERELHELILVFRCPASLGHTAKSTGRDEKTTAFRVLEDDDLVRWDFRYLTRPDERHLLVAEACESVEKQPSIGGVRSGADGLQHGETFREWRHGERFEPDDVLEARGCPHAEDISQGLIKPEVIELRR